MEKFKLFIDNVFIYGFGSIIGKIIPFIMLPIITRLMPDSSYYGLNDLSTTLVSIGQAIAVFGMYDAMFRLFFDREERKYQKEVCSTTLAFTLFTSVVVFILVIVFNKKLTYIVFSDIQYRYLVYLAAFSILVGATNNIVATPTKIQNESKIFVMVNTISPVIAYAIAIPLLLSGYYSFALQLSGLIASIMIEIFFVFRNKQWFSLRYINFRYIVPLLKIAAPLMPGFIIYWIYNSSDKLMIQYFIGTQAVGIYAVGSKLGQISNFIYTAFTGGWLYYSFSTMKEENQVENNSKIFEYLGIISFASSIVICAFSYIVYRFVFPNEYLQGFKVAPYLFLAPLLQMLFQVAANQFIIMKKSWPNVLILFFGAIINVISNLFLIPHIGIEGAAVGTLIGYFFADIICICVLTIIKKMKVSGKFIFLAAMTAFYFFIWGVILYRRIMVGIIIATLLIGLYSCLYRKEINQCFIMMRIILGSKKC